MEPQRRAVTAVGTVMYEYEYCRVIFIIWRAKKGDAPAITGYGYNLYFPTMPIHIHRQKKHGFTTHKAAVEYARRIIDDNAGYFSLLGES